VVKPDFHRAAIKTGSDRVVVVRPGFHRFAIKLVSDRIIFVSQAFIASLLSQDLLGL